MADKDNILFLRPPIYEGDPRYAPVLESLGIEYIVGYCRSKGLSVQYIDANLQNLSVDDICCMLDQTLPKLICITITTEKIREEVKRIINYVSKLKNEVRPIVCVGGHFVSYAFQEVLNDYSNIDIVSVGEGEYTIEKLIRCILNGEDYRAIEGLAYRGENGITYNDNKNNIVNDINKLPWPIRTYTKEAIKKSGLFCIIGSRGCYGNCKFCAVNSFTNKFNYKKWRGRDIEDVVAELEYGINKLNAEYILFCDDNFIEPGENGNKRIDLFVRLIREHNLNCKFAFFCRCNDIIRHKNLLTELVSVGWSHVFLGVESSSQRALNYYNKGITPEMSREAIKICRELGVMVEIGFIMFEPYSTLEEIKENMLFLKSLQLNSIFRFNTKLCVYYGSDFIELLNNDKLLIRDGYTISYKYKNKGIEVIEKLIVETYKLYIPVATLFYEFKDCVTVTWYKRKDNHVTTILAIENKINDELTNNLIKQIEYFESCKDKWNSDFFVEFLKDSVTKLEKIIQEYYFFLNLYIKTLDDKIKE